MLQPYMKNTQIIDCVSAAGIVPFDPLDFPNGFPAWTAYGMNTNLIMSGPSGFTGVSLAELQTPADTVFLADSVALGYTPMGKLARNNRLPPPSQRTPYLHGRHNGMANVLWLDGHVKAIKPTPPTGNVAPQSITTYLTNNIGYLAAPSGRSADVDYYFDLTKKS
jgi:prepilin-type processing-associated H-X9-DG protein